MPRYHTFWGWVDDETDKTLLRVSKESERWVEWKINEKQKVAKRKRDASETTKASNRSQADKKSD